MVIKSDINAGQNPLPFKVGNYKCQKFLVCSWPLELQEFFGSPLMRFKHWTNCNSRNVICLFICPF